MTVFSGQSFQVSKPFGVFHQKKVAVVQLLSDIQLFVTPWTTAHQASLFFTISRSLLKLMSIELEMPSNHLILLPSPAFYHFHTVHGVLKARMLKWFAIPFSENTGVGCHALLQGIFSTQGSNPSLLHCRQILYCLSHQGSPRILEWVAYPFCRGSFWPRNRTRVSCIAGRFFTSWATSWYHTNIRHYYVSRCFELLNRKGE